MGVSRSFPGPGTHRWWCGIDPIYVRYHDRERGVPVTGDRALWERLVLAKIEAAIASARAWERVMESGGRGAPHPHPRAATAVGMVSDHLLICPRPAACARLAREAA